MTAGAGRHPRLIRLRPERVGLTCRQRAAGWHADGGGGLLQTAGGRAARAHVATDHASHAQAQPARRPGHSGRAGARAGSGRAQAARDANGLRGPWTARSGLHRTNKIFFATKIHFSPLLLLFHQEGSFFRQEGSIFRQSVRLQVSSNLVESRRS